MKKKTYYLICEIILMGLVIIAMLFALNKEYSSDKASYVIINAVKIKVDLAQTPDQWAQGLMYRQSLPENHGMLFIFPNSDDRTFWMKNTLIPLDIIFIDSEGKIINIERAEPCKAEPCPKYISKEPAKYVLEVPEGFAEKKRIKEGDEIGFE